MDSNEINERILGQPVIVWSTDLAKELIEEVEVIIGGETVQKLKKHGKTLVEIRSGPRQQMPQ